MKRSFCFLLVSLAVCCGKDNTTENEEKVNNKEVASVNDTCNYLKNRIYQPVDDDYPIMLSFISSNEICGYHDANNYLGNYSIENNCLSFSNVSVTDVSDNEWYWNYINALHENYVIDISKHDTLRLVIEKESSALVFLSKQKLNTIVNTDSLYSKFSICKFTSDDAQNILQGTSWGLAYIECDSLINLK